MATFVKFNQFVQDVANKVHNLSSDTLKVMLTNTLPVATNAVLADLVEITPQNGYVAGGTAVTITSSTQTAGLYILKPSAAVVFTASGGSFGPFAWAVIYNATSAAPLKPLIGFWSYGSSISCNATDSFTVGLDLINGILQLQ